MFNKTNLPTKSRKMFRFIYCLKLIVRTTILNQSIHTINWQYSDLNRGSFIKVLVVLWTRWTKSRLRILLIVLKWALFAYFESSCQHNSRVNLLNSVWKSNTNTMFHLELNIIQNVKKYIHLVLDKLFYICI